MSLVDSFPDLLGGYSPAFKAKFTDAKYRLSLMPPDKPALQAKYMQSIAHLKALQKGVAKTTSHRNLLEIETKESLVRLSMPVFEKRVRVTATKLLSLTQILDRRNQL